MSENSSLATLDGLLDESSRDDATTTDRLTNHLPMALVAKAGLGADDAELRRFAEHYRSRVAHITPGVRHLTAATWRDAVGQPGSYPDFVDYFRGAIDDHDVDATVRAHLGELTPGLSGAAFHGVIRLAYALEVATPARVVTGLAYLASTARPLGTLQIGETVSNDPEELLNSLASDPHWRSTPRATSIGAQMRRVSDDPHFRDVAASLALDDSTPDRLRRVALKVYATTNDFTALHGVTGLEAIARLRGYVDDVERFDRSTFQALVAAYLSIGAPVVFSDDRLDELATTCEFDDVSVRTRAARSNDEHVSKLVYTSLRLARGAPGTRDETLYHLVAARAVRDDVSTVTPDSGGE